MDARRVRMSCRPSLARRELVRLAPKPQVDGIAQERDKGRREERDPLEYPVKGLVGRDLVVRHLVLPETPAAAAEVPVAELVDDEGLDRPRRAGELVGVEHRRDLADGRVVAREDPAVEEVRAANLALRLEAVDPGVEREEVVEVSHGAEEPVRRVAERGDVEALRKPRRAAREKIPAERVRPVRPQHVAREDGVAARFAHLLPVGVEHHSVRKAAPVRALLREKRPDHEERVEPAARLVHPLADELGRVLALEEVHVFVRVMVLGERH